jgi:uncharacterized protein (TIGR02145 family)
MCHNLGGLDIISPSQLITYEHHGDWYRFGAKNPSVVNTGTNNSAVSNWGNLPVYFVDADWPDAIPADPVIIGNPCPAGWRLPTYLEWDAVGYSFNNPQANVPAATWATGMTVFSNLKKLGNDLMLPSAGYRTNSDGALGGRSYGGSYWSSVGAGSSDCWFMNFISESLHMNEATRDFGASVRCVQAE